MVAELLEQLQKTSLRSLINQPSELVLLKTNVPKIQCTLEQLKKSWLHQQYLSAVRETTNQLKYTIKNCKIKFDTFNANWKMIQFDAAMNDRIISANIIVLFLINPFQVGGSYNILLWHKVNGQARNQITKK